MKEDDGRSAKEKPKTRALANPWQITLASSGVVEDNSYSWFTDYASERKMTLDFAEFVAKSIGISCGSLYCEEVGDPGGQRIKRRS